MRVDDIVSPRRDRLAHRGRDRRAQNDAEGLHAVDREALHVLALRELRIVARDDGDVVLALRELRRQRAHVGLHAADVRMEPRGDEGDPHGTA